MCSTDWISSFHSPASPLKQQNTRHWLKHSSTSRQLKPKNTKATVQTMMSLSAVTLWGDGCIPPSAPCSFFSSSSPAVFLLPCGAATPHNGIWSFSSEYEATGAVWMYSWREEDRRTHREERPAWGPRLTFVILEGCCKSCEIWSCI